MSQPPATAASIALRSAAGSVTHSPEVLWIVGVRRFQPRAARAERTVDEELHAAHREVADRSWRMARAQRLGMVRIAAQERVDAQR